MTDALRSDEWWHTAAICSTLANIHRDPKKKPYKTEDFHPLFVKKKSVPIPVPIDVLKTVFVDNKVPDLRGFHAQ